MGVVGGVGGVWGCVGWGLFTIIKRPTTFVRCHKPFCHNSNTAPPSLVWTCGLKPFSTIQWKVEVAAKTEKVHRERQGCELVAPPRGAPRADASSLVAMASLSGDQLVPGMMVID